MPLDPRLLQLLTNRRGQGAQYDDSDDTSDATAQDAATTSTPTADGGFLSPAKAQLYSALQQRQAMMNQADNATRAGQSAANQTSYGNQTTSNSNNLLAALAKSASQFGMVGGKTADASAPEQMAQATDAQAQTAQKEFDQQNALTQKGLDSRVNAQDKLIQTAETGVNREDVARQHSQDLKSRLDQQSDDLRFKMAQLAAQKEASANALSAQKSDVAAARSSDGQHKALKDTQSMLEQMRGAPQLQQAEKDIYAAAKADALASKYKDPNNMSPQEVELLTGEIAKIAQGGSPSMHELDNLSPQTAQMWLARLTQKGTSTPTPAGAGAFVKNYQDYAHEVTNKAKAMIMDKYGRVLNVNKHYLAPDDYNNLDTQYLQRFMRPEWTPPAQTDVGPQPAPAASSGLPFSQDAIQAEMKRRGL